MGLRKLLVNKQEASKKESLRNMFCFFDRLNVFDLLVVLMCLASFCCSWIESMVNYDSLHWGWTYGPILDLKRGAIPFSEIFMAYGYVPALVSVMALTVFGERLMNIGIVTGLFYSLTLFLSYRVFVSFLQKQLAFIAVLLVFLIHPYIIYPGVNYYA
jgi:hypothetical protein